MNKQLILDEGFEKYMKTTKRARSLSDMDRIIPWADLRELIAPVYSAAGNSRLLLMRRVQMLDSGGGRSTTEGHSSFMAKRITLWRGAARFRPSLWMNF